LGIQGTRQHIRHFYYLLIKKSTGTGYTAALGTPNFMHRFYKYNVLPNLFLGNGGYRFAVVIFKQQYHFCRIVFYDALTLVLYQQYLAEFFNPALRIGI
jgi:hypothetical protein